MRRLPPRTASGRFKRRRNPQSHAMAMVMGELDFLHRQGKQHTKRYQLLERRFERMAERGEEERPLFFESHGHAIPYEAHLQAAGMYDPEKTRWRARHEARLRRDEEYDRLERAHPAALRTGAGSRRQKLSHRVQGTDLATAKRKRTMAAVKAGTKAARAPRGDAFKRAKSANRAASRSTQAAAKRRRKTG